MTLLALAAFVAACDDDDGDGRDPTATAPAEATEPAEPTATEEDAGVDAAAVEAVITAYAEAWNASDVDGLVALFTDAGLEDQFLRTREETVAFLPAIIGDPQVSLGPFSGTQVDGAAAATTADFFIGVAGSPQTFALVNEGGAWLIDDQNPITGPTPDGATVVDMSMVEYAFEFDAGAVSADMAFNVSNDGVELHEMSLFTVPEGVPLDGALSAEGTELVGQLFGVEAGTQATLTFSEELAPARYVMVCFIPAPDGTPHFTLGMIDEFTIE